MTGTRAVVRFRATEKIDRPLTDVTEIGGATQ